MLLPLLTALVVSLYSTEASDCRVEDCSQWFSRTKEYELLTEGRSERYCQVLHTYLQCLSDTLRFCHGNIKFHSIQYLMKRQFRDYRCEHVEHHKNHENRCHFVPSAGQRSVRYCSLYGDPHVRRFDGSFQTCSEHGARPLLDNRYFLVQISARHHNISSFTTFVDKVTVIIRKHNCTQPLAYMAASDYLPHSFDDGTSFVSVHGNKKSIEVIQHEEGYVELNLRYIDSSIHIRKVGEYLSVAVRGPEFVLGAASSLQDQLCWDGCRPKKLISIEKALAAPRAFSACYQQKLRMSPYMAAGKSQQHSSMLVHFPEKCRTAGTVDSFFDSCVFDLAMTGDEKLLQMSRLAQSDFQRVFPLHYHYVQGRSQLIPYENLTDISYHDCLPPKSSDLLPPLLPLILLLFQFV